MKESNTTPGIDRRGFIAKTSLGALGAAGFLASCTTDKQVKEEIQLPKLLDQAPDGKVLKAGLIGCGGRGTGAAINFLDAGPNLQITALSDVFQDKIDQCRAELKTLGARVSGPPARLRRRAVAPGTASQTREAPARRGVWPGR